MTMKQCGLWLLLLPLSLPFALGNNIPTINQYLVKDRSFAASPSASQLSIAATDQSYLVKPRILYYTQLNPLQPQQVYTIPPYPKAKELPSIGKWMLHASNKVWVPAHWLDLTSAAGKYIIEPINYLLIVQANNVAQAKTLLINSLKKSGFSTKNSDFHTGGYSVYINSHLFSQLKNTAGVMLTFSNGDFRQQADHFRALGPAHTRIGKMNTYLFAGSVSEETGVVNTLANRSVKEIKKWLKQQRQLNAHITSQKSFAHHFVSFSSARNNLAVALIQQGYPTYYLIANNTVNTVGETTVDHDGKVFVTLIGFSHRGDHFGRLKEK